MKKGLVSVNVVMDRSGSMAGLAQDTIGSFNSFLAEQKKLPGEVLFTQCIFNHDYHLLHDFVKLSAVPDLTSASYAPYGNTALLDAVGFSIDTVGKKLAAMKEEDRPEKVVFLIITDGEENCSHRYTRAQISSMIEHQKSKYSWTFAYMGADVSTFAEAQSLGVTRGSTLQYKATKGGTHQLYATASNSLGSLRSSVGPVMDFFSTTPAADATSTDTPTTDTPPSKISGTKNSKKSKKVSK